MSSDSISCKDAEGSRTKQIEPGASRLNRVRVLNHLIVPGVLQNERHVAELLITCILLEIADKLGCTFLRELGIVIPRHLIEPKAIELEALEPVLADVGDKLLRAGVIVVEREHTIGGCRHKLT